ncbi:MAG: GWxTD domain-containing protein [Bacteroidota bacterium]
MTSAVSAQAWLDGGLEDLREGDRTEAAAWFAEGVAADPGDVQARVLLALAEAADARTEAQALNRALLVVPDRPELYAMRLDRLRRDVGEARVVSVADSRRIEAARRLVALDAGSALGHEELALYAFLDYQWRRRNAERRQMWNPSDPPSATRAALRALAEAHRHLDAATEADPAWPGAHRLRMRIAAFDRDPQALTEAASAARRARPRDPWTALYQGLALARSRRTPEAEAACRLGADALPSAERAVFESPARFVRPDDRAAFEADSAGWSARFWARRDGRLLTEANERWVEHCARVVEADLLYRADDVRGWNTARGDTHIRYGAPQADTWWLALGDGRFHRWVYPGFAVTFHDWVSSGDYLPQSRSDGEDDATRLRSRNNTVGEVGADASGSPLAVSASAFRSTDGGVEWVVAYRAETSGSRASLRAGLFVRDAEGDILDRRRVPSASLVAHRGGWTGAATVPARGATLVVEADRPGAETFGRGEVALPERSFAGDSLRLSDLLLAYRVDVAGPEAVPPGHVRRGDVVLHPAPDEPLSTGDPLGVYVEAYGLRLDGASTRFEVEAVLQPVDEAGRLRRLGRRLLGRRGPASVSVAAEQTGSASDDAVALTLDLQNQPPGLYRLTLTLRDLTAAATASVSRTVRLDSP